MVAGNGYSTPSAIFASTPRRTLPERGLGQSIHDHGLAESGDRPNMLAHQRHTLAQDSFLLAFNAGLQANESQRRLPFQFVGNTGNRALGHVGMHRQNLFQRTGGQPVAGNVDHVVGPGHHVDVALLVHIAGVAGRVEALVLAQIGLPEALVRLPERRQRARRQRQAANDGSRVTGGYFTA